MAESRQVVADLVHLVRAFVAQQERQRPGEPFGVTLIVADAGQHLVRRRREQKHPRGRLVEEHSGKFAVVARPVEDVGEALELVQDDQVRGEQIDARLRQRSTQPADETSLLCRVHPAAAVRPVLDLFDKVLPRSEPCDSRAPAQR